MAVCEWALPPPQKVLSADEALFDLESLASNLTVVMSTSVGEFTPATDRLIAALESVQANLALRWCKKLLVFDKVPSKDQIDAMKTDRGYYREVVRGAKWEKMWNEKREDYDVYCDSVRKLHENNHPALFRTELIFLEDFGHLQGTVQRAFKDVDTAYTFVTQHDLRLGGKFEAADVQSVVEALHRGYASYILLNRDVNSAPRTRVYFNMDLDAPLPDLPLGLHLTPVAGFSDQAHFVDSEWYRQEVLGAIPVGSERTCMEHVLHDSFKKCSDKGTFLFGGLGDGPYVYDLIHGITIVNPEGRLQGVPSMPVRQIPT